MIAPAPRCGAIGALLAAVVALGGLPRSASAEDVDLQLIFAVDVSPSVDADEYALQIGGLADALRDPAVVDAISSAGPNGVAVALMQWAGAREHVLSVPWAVLRDETTAEAFAASIEAVTRPVTNGGTAIGDALTRCIEILGESGFRSARRVIDVSGDGSTNIGDSPAPVRARAESLGITVNGLVILNEEPRLDAYYYKRVVGGPGAFILHIQNFGDFASAIRLKLLREIDMAMMATPAPAEGTGIAMTD